MSSSTKMYGPGILRTSQSRTSTDTATMPPSHATSGTRAARSRTALPTEVELGQPAGDLRSLGAAGGDADRGGRVAHLVENRTVDSGAARNPLERGRLTRGDVLEVVLGPRQRERGGAHRLPHVGPLGE